MALSVSTNEKGNHVTASFPTLLGIMLMIFVTRPIRGVVATVFKVILIMGAVGQALTLSTVGQFSDWANSINSTVGATVVGGSLVAVGLNFAIQQADIPYLPDNAEKILRYVLYALGGVLMMGSSQWGSFFTSTTGLLNGQGAGIIGIVTSILQILTLGLSGG
jgi:hypothetical protein